MARGNLYTGLHYQHNGVYENVPLPIAQGLYPWVPTLGTMMQDAGYETAYFGKWHLTSLPWDHELGRKAMSQLLASYGFEVSDQSRELDGTYSGYRHDGETALGAARFLSARRQPTRPWIAAVNFVNPHDIMYFLASPQQRKTFVSALGDELLPAPDEMVYRQQLEGILPTAFGSAGDRDKPAAHALFKQVMDLAFGQIPAGDLAAWQRHENYYLNCLRDVDRHIGIVIDALEASGQAEHTIIVFTSDHGELSGAHGLRGKGNTIYRESASLPLAIKHPDIRGGVDTIALASQLDIVPTLLSLAGVSATERAEFFPGLKGVDLATAMGSGHRDIGGAGRSAALYQWDSLAFCSPKLVTIVGEAHTQRRLNKAWTFLANNAIVREALHHRSSLRGAFDGRYKFARYFSPLQHHRPSSWDELLALNDLELYDTESDPQERINVSADPAYHDIVWRMAQTINALVDHEIGTDVGQMLPGPRRLWTY
jgi:arylsulfatase